MVGGGLRQVVRRQRHRRSRGDRGGQWAGVDSGDSASVRLGGSGRWWHIRRLGAAGDGEDDGAGASRRHRSEKKERGKGLVRGGGPRRRR